ncbi:MAG: response regulator, partial [Proteobacteria bacterium]|nr:response regulator [Pseudomonadota bacterium]
MNDRNKHISTKKHPYYIAVFTLWIVIVLVALFVFNSIKQFTKDNLISEFNGVANNISNFSSEPLLFQNLARIQLDVIENPLVFLNRLDFVYVVDTQNRILLSNHENKIGETFINRDFNKLILEKKITHIQNRNFYFKIYTNRKDKYFSLSINPAMGQLDYYPDGVYNSSIYFSLKTDNISRNFEKIFYALVLGTIAIITLLSIVVKMFSEYYVGPFSLFLGKLSELSSGVNEPININKIKGPLRRFVTHFNEVIYTLVEVQQKEKELELQKGIVRATQVLAHDVRKPFSQMCFILDSLDRLQSDSDGLNSAKCEVEKSIKHVESMINDILDYSREVELSTEPCSLYRIFDYVIRQSQQDFPSSRISFDYRLSARFMPLVDEERMARVFGNIISNAIEAITEGNERREGTIVVISQDVVLNGRNMIEITIGNNGPPFERGTVNKLFNTFYTHGKKKGTGLGLASAQKIVNLHKGTITARNKENGKGVEFITQIVSSDTREPVNTAHLPMRLGIDQMPAPRDTDVNRAVKRISRNKELIPIILLEDEVLYRAGVRNLINSEPALSKKVILYDATTVDDALALMENGEIGHAIVDIDLNDTQNGYDFLTIVKEKYPNLNCLVHTNRIIDEDKKKALDLGVKHFAPKPLNLANLVCFISNVPLNEGKIGESLAKIPEHKTVTLLIVDDDPLILKTLANSVEDYFRQNSIPCQLLTAGTYRRAEDLLNSYHAELNYVLSDLHIDANTDGLLLADKTLELKNQTDRDIQFFVFTHSNVGRLNKTISRSRVKRFYRHPVLPSVLKDIFENEPTVESRHTVTGSRNSTPNSEIESCSLPVLLRLMNKKILRKACRLIGHNIAGELEIMKHNLLNTAKEEGNQKDATNRLLPSLPEVTEQLQSFLDIAKYSDPHNLKNLFIVPFN